MNHLTYLVGAWLFGIGLYGISTSRNLIHLCLCLTVVQSSTYIILLGIGYRTAGIAPVYTKAFTNPVVDPVVQALMLTDVVVEATVLALLLALSVQIHKRRQTIDPERIAEMRG